MNTLTTIEDLTIAKRHFRGKPEPQGPRLNGQIRAQQIRLIKPDNSHELTTPERGMQLAEMYNLDLVEISPNANPPVCKIIDYGKYQYEKKKKE